MHELRFLVEKLNDTLSDNRTSTKAREMTKDLSAQIQMIIERMLVDD